MIHSIQKRLTDAFDVFDGDKTKTVDAKLAFFFLQIILKNVPKKIQKLFSSREMPTIIYSLNLVPTQGEIRDLITEVSFNIF